MGSKKVSALIPLCTGGIGEARRGSNFTCNATAHSLPASHSLIPFMKVSTCFQPSRGAAAKVSSVAAALILFLFSTGCQTYSGRAVGTSSKPNSVAVYFHNAELQFETPAQGAEIRRALEDILNLSPEDLRKRRYANYQLVPESWDILTLIRSYFVPEKPLSLEEARFYQDMTEAPARKEVENQLRAVNEALAK